VEVGASSDRPLFARHRAIPEQIAIIHLMMVTGWQAESAVKISGFFHPTYLPEGGIADALVNGFRGLFGIIERFDGP